MLAPEQGYSACGLFTLAIFHCLERQSPGGAGDFCWGAPKNQSIDSVIREDWRPQLEEDEWDEFVGWDVVGPGGILDQVYLHLQLPRVAWAPLKYLPCTHSTSGSHHDNVAQLLNLMGASGASEGLPAQGESGDVCRRALLALLEGCMVQCMASESTTAMVAGPTTSEGTAKGGPQVAPPPVDPSRTVLEEEEEPHTSDRSPPRRSSRPVSYRPPHHMGYDSRSRVALHLVSQWLGVPWDWVAQKEMELDSLALSREKEKGHGASRSSWWGKAAKWSAVGAAAVGGGALMAITGGLAAPVVVPVVGGLLSTTGALLGLAPLGAAAAGALTGFVGSAAGAAVVTAALGGAGAGLASSKVIRRLADVQEFGFWPLLDPLRAAALTGDMALNWPPGGGGEVGGADMGSTELAPLGPLLPCPCLPVSHVPSCLGTRMAVTIAVSGWISDKKEFELKWQGLPAAHYDRDCFSLVWEGEELVKLDRETRAWATSMAASSAATWFLSTFVSAAMMSAMMLPMTVVSATNLIDSQWTIVMDRARKAGVLLAYELMTGAHGSRPVSLIGYSMGARVICYCLRELAVQGRPGLVEEVILMGTPVDDEVEHWEDMRRVVAGRLVNAYCPQDWILGVLYRSRSGFLRRSAGIGPIELEGVTNVDVSDLVDGHLGYCDKVEELLGRLVLNEGASEQ